MSVLTACPNRKNQRGVVLVIALIALVALSLAGIAMMRSVDAGNLISGNMSFKQASVVMSDFAMNRAMAHITGGVITDRNNNFSTYYFATPRPLDQFGVPDVLSSDIPPPPLPFQRVPSCLRLDPTNPSNTSITPNATTFWILDGNNNNTGFCASFVIERMCSSAGVTKPPKTDYCVLSSSGGLSAGGGLGTGEKLKSQESPYYRITIRTEGPSNTQSYVQGFLSTP